MLLKTKGRRQSRLNSDLRLQPCSNSNLVDFGLLARESVPQDDGALVVAAGQKVLVVAAPADTAATKNTRITSPPRGQGSTPPFCFRRSHKRKLEHLQNNWPGCGGHDSFWSAPNPSFLTTVNTGDLIFHQDLRPSVALRQTNCPPLVYSLETEARKVLLRVTHVCLEEQHIWPT